MKRLIASSLCAAIFTIAGCTSAPDNSSTTTVSTNTAPANAPAEPARAFARGLHLVPGLGPLSLKAGDDTFAQNLAYGNATPFAGLKDTKLKIEAFGGDGKRVAGPMPQNLDGGEDLTVLITGVPGDVALLPFKHKNHGAQAGKAKVAFVHAAKALPKVDVSIDGRTFRRDVKYGIATDYTVLTPGRHTMRVEYDKSLAPLVTEVEQPTVITEDTGGNVVAVEQPTPIKTVIPRAAIVTLTQEMDLLPGKVYSVAVFHDEMKLPKLRLLEDKFVPELSRAPAAN